MNVQVFLVCSGRGAIEGSWPGQNRKKIQAKERGKQGSESTVLENMNNIFIQAGEPLFSDPSPSHLPGDPFINWAVNIAKQRSLPGSQTQVAPPFQIPFNLSLLVLLLFVNIFLWKKVVTDPDRDFPSEIIRIKIFKMFICF